jgi:hypothetical protein
MLQRESSFELRSRASPHRRPAEPFGPLSIGGLFRHEDHVGRRLVLESGGRQDAPLGRFLLVTGRRNARLIQKTLDLRLHPGARIRRNCAEGVPFRVSESDGDEPAGVLVQLHLPANYLARLPPRCAMPKQNYRMGPIYFDHGFSVALEDRHWLNPKRAPRREITCGRGHSHDEERCAEIGGAVGGRDLEEESPQDA